MKNIKEIFMKFIKNKKAVSIVTGLLVLLIAVVVIANLFFVNKDLNTKKLKNENVYIYFGKEKFDYKGNITLDHENNITNIKLDNKKVKLFFEPVYSAKDSKLILPCVYSVVNTSVGTQNKVNYYTEMVKIDDDIYLKNKDLNYKLNNHFLFDGSDFYIFIQESVVSFGGKKINISPLSYVNYVFDTNELYIYDYENDKVYHYDNIKGDVVVTNDNYSVNVSSDIMNINKKEKLLMKNFDYLKKLK